jgi:hypothetical protein
MEEKLVKNCQRHRKFVAICLFLVVPGCKGDEADIAAAISAYLSNNKGYCLTIDDRADSSGHRLKVEIDKTFRKEFLAQQQREINQTETLEKFGLIQVTRSRRDGGEIFALFVPTSSGSPFFIKQHHRESYGLCMGRQELVKLRDHTPAAVNHEGLTTTSVRFAFRILDFPTWSQEKEIQSAFSSFENNGHKHRVGFFPGHRGVFSMDEHEKAGLAEVISAPVFESSLQLFKTNKGWTWDIK